MTDVPCPRPPRGCGEKHVGRVLVERSRRLVEDQHLGLDRQRLGDFQQVLLRHRQRVAARPQRHAQTDGVEHLARDVARRLSSEQRSRQRDLEILEHRQIVEHRGVLKGNRNSQATRPSPATSRKCDAPRIRSRLVPVGACTGDDVHEGRLAGPVLAKNGVNLTRVEFDADIRQRCNARIEL